MFDQIRDFVLQNLNVIISVLVAILTLVFTILGRYKKSKDILSSIKESILELMPEWINIAELSMESGAEKKDFVLSLAVSFARSIGASEQIVKIIYNFASSHLESILSTPQKH